MTHPRLTAKMTRVTALCRRCWLFLLRSSFSRMRRLVQSPIRLLKRITPVDMVTVLSMLMEADTEFKTKSRH